MKIYHLTEDQLALIRYELQQVNNPALRDLAVGHIRSVLEVVERAPADEVLPDAYAAEVQRREWISLTDRRPEDGQEQLYPEGGNQ